MVNANVKIISELKAFITLVSSNREILNKFCAAETSFTRARKLPFEKLVLFITKLCKKTLSIELDHFFEEIRCSMSCSVSAFTQQRVKLDPMFFYFWNMVFSALVGVRSVAVVVYVGQA